MTQSRPEGAGLGFRWLLHEKCRLFYCLTELNFAASFLVEFFRLDHFISVKDREPQSLGDRAGYSTGTGGRRTVCHAASLLDRAEPRAGRQQLPLAVCFFGVLGWKREGPCRKRPRRAAGGGGSRRLGQWERCPRASQAMAAAGGDGGPAPAEDGGADIGGGSALAAAPGRAQVFTTVVDTFLEKLVAAGR